MGSRRKSRGSSDTAIVALHVPRLSEASIRSHEARLHAQRLYCRLCIGVRTTPWTESAAAMPWGRRGSSKGLLDSAASTQEGTQPAGDGAARAQEGSGGRKVEGQMAEHMRANSGQYTYYEFESHEDRPRSGRQRHRPRRASTSASYEDYQAEACRRGEHDFRLVSWYNAPKPNAEGLYDMVECYACSHCARMGYERLVTTECHYQPTAGEQVLSILSGMTSAVCSTVAAGGRRALRAMTRRLGKTDLVGALLDRSQRRAAETTQSTRQNLPATQSPKGRSNRKPKQMAAQRSRAAGRDVRGRPPPLTLNDSSKEVTSPGQADVQVTSPDQRKQRVVDRARACRQGSSSTIAEQKEEPASHIQAGIKVAQEGAEEQKEHDASPTSPSAASHEEAARAKVDQLCPDPYPTSLEEAHALIQVLCKELHKSEAEKLRVKAEFHKFLAAGGMDIDAASDPLLEVPPPDVDVAKMEVEKVVHHVTELSRASQVEENKMKKSRMEKLLDTWAERMRAHPNYHLVDPKAQLLAKYMTVCEVALRCLRSFVPPHIWDTTKGQLTDEGKLSKRAIMCLWSNRALWLLRATPAHHRARLSGNTLINAAYSPNGLNHVGTLALYLCPPPEPTDEDSDVLKRSRRAYKELVVDRAWGFVKRLEELRAGGAMPADDSPQAFLALLKNNCPLFYAGEIGCQVLSEGPYDPDEETVPEHITSSATPDNLAVSIAPGSVLAITNAQAGAGSAIPTPPTTPGGSSAAPPASSSGVGAAFAMFRKMDAGNKGAGVKPKATTVAGGGKKSTAWGGGRASTATTTTTTATTATAPSSPSNGPPRLMPLDMKAALMARARATPAVAATAAEAAVLAPSSPVGVTAVPAVGTSSGATASRGAAAPMPAPSSPSNGPPRLMPLDMKAALMAKARARATPAVAATAAEAAVLAPSSPVGATTVPATGATASGGPATSPASGGGPQAGTATP